MKSDNNYNIGMGQELEGNIRLNDDEMHTPTIQAN